MSGFPKRPFQRPGCLEWTKEHDLQILNLHNDGRSYSEIARACGVTKNMVIGRIYRMRKRGNGPPLRIKLEKPLRERELPFSAADLGIMAITRIVLANCAGGARQIPLSLPRLRWLEVA